uniref:J domain-containing protein n=1 Tax=Astatotilapia calliptera TaxID=8154 RepID=A0A3P8NQI5_ASTCA
MEREASKKEMDVVDTDEEFPDGVSASVTSSSQCEVEDECEQEDKIAYLKSQETPNPATLQDVGAGEAEAKDDIEEVSEEFEHDKTTENENSQVINQEEDDAAKEQHMNGESGWRNIGSGRKCKLRSSGSVLEQIQRGNVMSSGGRHKQTRRRNHHHYQQNRGRRRTGNQLILAFKEMLSECLSFWCISCIHMMIEIIVTLTHNCGVGVETGVVKLYNLGQQLLVKITDVPAMKADAIRILKWAKCKGACVVDKTVRSVKWIKTVALSCFTFFCALAILGLQWAKGVFLRIGGDRGKHYWTAFQETRIWKRIMSLLEKARSLFRRDGHVPPSAPGSPGRAGRAQPGQELERLLALVEVPEDELDPFTVLGVEVHATDTELKKAYRQLAVQVHPDKNKHPRAGEAFKVLRAAWDIVSNPETRREYELKRMAATELSKSMNEFLTKLQDDLKEAMNTMMCTKCEGKHKLSAQVCFICFLCVYEGASRWIVNPLRPGSVLNAIVAIAPRKGTCGLNRACWAYASHTLPVWMARCMILQSGQVARELEFLLIHTGSRITSPLVQRTTAMPHDTGRRRSKRQVRPTQLICRTSSTESLREDLLMTWLPMEASSTQVRLITHLVLERLPSPLLQVRQVFTCREVTGPSPARRGLKVANPPGGGRRSANPSRGEVRRLISV